MVEKFYSAQEVAEMLSLHPKTVQRYIREGRLKAQKFGKAWRVSGHDLSVFLEGTDGAPAAATPGLQGIIGEARGRIRVSAVVDIPVKGTEEAARVMNWVSSAMNSRRDGDYSSVTTQFIQPENLLRLMLWGNPALVQGILRSLNDMEQEG